MCYFAFDHRSCELIDRCAAIVSELPYIKRSHLFENFIHVRFFIIGELATSQRVPDLRRRHLHRTAGHPWPCNTPHLSRNEVGPNVQVRVVEILERNYWTATTIRIRVLTSGVEFVAHISIVSGNKRKRETRFGTVWCISRRISGRGLLRFADGPMPAGFSWMFKTTGLVKGSTKGMETS